MANTDEFVRNLLEEMRKAIALHQAQFLVWSSGTDGLRVLGAIRDSGLEGFVAGVVNSDKAMQGREVAGFMMLAPSELVRLEFDTLVVAADGDKEVVLQEFARLDGRMVTILVCGDRHYEFNDPAFAAIVSSCHVKSKAGGYPHMLIHLYQALRHICARKLDGSIAEFGVFQGGTTVFMAKVLQHFGSDAKVYGFDTFAGFPPQKHALDLYSDVKCEFPYFDVVQAYCAPYNIELIRGDISETHRRLIGVPLAMTFFDADNYSTARSALPLCYEQTVSGGILAFDHYYSPNWVRTVGERIAIKEVLGARDVFNLHGTGIFVKA
jgi:O-methyltransferase